MCYLWDAEFLCFYIGGRFVDRELCLGVVYYFLLGIGLISGLVVRFWGCWFILG